MLMQMTDFFHSATILVATRMCVCVRVGVGGGGGWRGGGRSCGGLISILWGNTQLQGIYYLLLYADLGSRWYFGV